MKKILSLSFFAIHLYLFSQSTVQKTEYFDWKKTKLAHTWFEFGDGTKHGSEKYYYDNGKLQVEYNWSKGEIKKALSYYNDGTQSLISNHYNNRILDGEVKFYNWLNGTRFLQYNGIAMKVADKDYDKVSFMEIYYAPNKKLLSFTDNGVIQEYIEFANSIRHTDELGYYEPKTISSGQSKITVSKGIIQYGKCNGDEIVDGKFTKIGNFSGKASAKIEGDTVVMTELTELDSIVYTKIKSWDIRIELSPVMSVNPMNEYLNFNLSYKIPGASIFDKIFVVNFNERSNDLSGLFNEYWKKGYSDVGFYRKYSRKNKNLSYESYTALENNTLVVKYKKWFYENGKLKEFWDSKTTKKYSENGTLNEKISADTIQRYFENGLLALDSTSKYSRAYFLNGKISRDISMVSGSVNTYKIYDTLGSIIFQGEIKTSISNKNKDALAIEEKLNYKYTLAEENMESIKKDVAYKNLNHETIIFYNDENDKILGGYLFKFYQELWNQLTLEGVYLNNSLKPFQNLNWDESYGRIEKDVIPKDIYLNLCFLYYSKATSIYSQMDGLINKFELILKSADKKKVIKSLKKATSDSEIKSILGI